MKTNRVPFNYCNLIMASSSSRNAFFVLTRRFFNRPSLIFLKILSIKTEPQIQRPAILHLSCNTDINNSHFLFFNNIQSQFDRRRRGAEQYNIPNFIRSMIQELSKKGSCSQKYGFLTFCNFSTHTYALQNEK